MILKDLKLGCLICYGNIIDNDKVFRPAHKIVCKSLFCCKQNVVNIVGNNNVATEEI